MNKKEKLLNDETKQVKRKKKNSTDFINEANRLLNSSKKESKKEGDLLFLNVGSLFEKNEREVITSHLNSMKTVHPFWCRFEHALILYEYMNQYKEKYPLKGREEFKSIIDSVEGKKNHYNYGQLIKKVLRIHYFFFYLFKNNCYDAHQNCSFSIQDFYEIFDNEWVKVAVESGFYEDYIYDLKYWSIRGKKYSDMVILDFKGW
jgi:hypothetical protein